MRRILLLLSLLSALLALPCRAAAPEEALKELYDGLPKEVADALPDGVEEGIQKGDAAAAAGALDAAFLFDAIGSFLEKAVKDSLSPLLTLTTALLLSSLLHAFSDTAGETVSKALDLAAGLSVLLAVFRVVKPVWELTADTIKGIGLLTKCSLPAMTALCAASGSLSSSAVNSAWLASLLALTEQLTETVLTPLFGIGFGFLAVSLFSRLTDSADLSGVAAGIKGIFTFFLTLMGTVLTAVMTYQSVLAQSADTVLLRSIKFASGTLIPMVGGALSETAGSYLASLSLLRSSAGLLTAVSLLLYVLPPILTLLVCRFGFSLIATVAGLLGCGKEGDAVREAAGLLDLALAAVSVLSAIFLILAGVFASTAVSV